MPPQEGQVFRNPAPVENFAGAAWQPRHIAIYQQPRRVAVRLRVLMQIHVVLHPYRLDPGAPETITVLRVFIAMELHYIHRHGGQHPVDLVTGGIHKQRHRGNKRGQAGADLCRAGRSHYAGAGPIENQTNCNRFWNKNQYFANA